MFAQRNHPLVTQRGSKLQPRSHEAVHDRECVGDADGAGRHGGLSQGGHELTHSSGAGPRRPRRGQGPHSESRAAVTFRTCHEI